MLHNALAEAIRTRDRLFPLIYEFNLLPARYVHESWWAKLAPGSLSAEVLRHPRAEAAISDLLLGELGLFGDWQDDFSRSETRLALLDPNALERLALFAGAVLRHRAIRAAIDRETVMSWRETIGGEAYAFAFREGPLLLPPDDGNGRLGDDGGRAALRSAGFAMIAACLADELEAVLKRVMLKLPADELTLRRPGGFDKSRTFPFLLRLLRRIEPRWAFLFS